ncbi:unnamed protein product, partial [Gordionus sp. m RMFG-2023]
MISIINKNIDV